MLGTGQNKKGKKVDIYLDNGFKSKAKNGFGGGTVWNFNILEENSKGYKVYVTKSTSGKDGSIFSPRTFWLRKEDVNVSFYKPPTQKVQGLETGDTMILSDKNGKRLGVWTFKAE